MSANPLAPLTPSDWSLLRQHGRVEQFPRDAVILPEGAATPGLLVLREGAVRVEQLRGGAPITLARLGPGELLGEMSFLEDLPASASVVADEPVTVERFDRAAVHLALQSDPGLSARFYQSLAVLLAGRLRERSRTRGETPSTPARDPRHGLLSARQIPASLSAGVDTFRRALADAELRLARRHEPADAVWATVRDACDGVVTLLRDHLRADALFDAGFADLGAFRDPDGAAAGIGAYVFRHTFSALMSSATAARAYARPRGVFEDWETSALIHLAEPDGEGALGPLVDRWFLDRPWCEARRAARRRTLDALRAVSVGADPARPAQVTLLASSVGDEALEIAQSPEGRRLRITCVDLDESALREGALRASEGGVADRVRYLRGDVAPVPPSPLPLAPQDLVVLSGLLEHLDDDRARAALRVAFDALRPGGLLLATHLDHDPDRALLEHLLGWPLHPRGEAALRDLAPPGAELSRAGADLCLRVTKGSVT